MKNKRNWYKAFSIILMFNMFLLILLILINSTISRKPVLYLYPEEDTNVKITFDDESKLLSTYPKYEKEWNVLAKKDGTLVDENGREYYALYWDENINHNEKFKTGFYVKSKNSIKFLEEKLFEMGFTDKEANEFIMYWLPIMEQGGDNLVHFHFNEDRQKQNKINIEPKVDSLFRFLDNSSGFACNIV